MINRKTMNLFGLAMVIGTALFAEAVSAQVTNGAKPLLTFNDLAGNSLNGAWQLNAAESDNVLEKAHRLLQPTSEKTAVAGKQSAGQTESPALSISLFPPEMLVLASGGDAEMTVNENFTNVVLTRTVTTDGKTRLYPLNAGVNYSVAAIGKGNLLTIETSSPRGNKMTEIYELVEGGKLKVTVRIEDSAAQELLTLHRVYDRTILDVFTGDAAEIQ